MANPASITGKYLTGMHVSAGARQPAARSKAQGQGVIGARANNLKNVSAESRLACSPA
jgi:excinuclease UvrABC ATPase subunit